MKRSKLRQFIHLYVVKNLSNTGFGKHITILTFGFGFSIDHQPQYQARRFFLYWSMHPRHALLALRFYHHGVPPMITRGHRFTIGRLTVQTGR